MPRRPLRCRNCETQYLGACARVGQGFAAVVVTLGDRGAVLAKGAKGNGATHRRIAPCPVTARDTTGAGDAFIGSLAVFLAEDLPEDEALARASLYAALSTTHVGTQKAFASRQSFDGEWSRRATG